jgi:carboxyl-terminal processing protease
VQFKGRTVLAFIILAMFASSILTLTITDSTSWGFMSKTAGSAANAPAASSGLTDKDLSKLSTTYKLIESKFLSSVDHDKLINGAIN